MKKIISFIIVFLFFMLTACEVESIVPNTSIKPEVHTHNFVDGKCNCGEIDPNYIPHVHEFVEGECECGEMDPNYVKIQHIGNQQESVTCYSDVSSLSETGKEVVNLIYDIFDQYREIMISYFLSNVEFYSQFL